jgi:chromosome segregation ATPase
MKTEQAQQYIYKECNVPDLTDMERERIDGMNRDNTFMQLAGMVVRLEREVGDLKWQVENLEDEKNPLEDEIQSGKEQIDELNNEIDRIQKAAAAQSGQIRKLQTANEALRAAARYWRNESKNSRHYVKKCERIIAELACSEE